MRESEFWALMEDEFGDAYAGLLARTQHLGELDDRTAEEAIEAGVPPRRVWETLCDQMSVPEDRRLGRVRPLRRGPIPD